MEIMNIRLLRIVVERPDQINKSVHSLSLKHLNMVIYFIMVSEQTESWVQVSWSPCAWPMKKAACKELCLRHNLINKSVLFLRFKLL